MTGVREASPRHPGMACGRRGAAAVSRPLWPVWRAGLHAARVAGGTAGVGGTGGVEATVSALLGA